MSMARLALTANHIWSGLPVGRQGTLLSPQASERLLLTDNPVQAAGAVRGRDYTLIYSSAERCSLTWFAVGRHKAEIRAHRSALLYISV